MIKDAILQLNNELATLRKFVALLTSEQEFLLSNDTENLLTLSDVKTQLANRLMEIANSRRKALLANSSDNMEAWIAKNAPGALPLWNDIQKFAAEAQHLNNTNGELINSKMRNNQQALSVLFNSGKSAAGIYGPDGQANIANSGRHLGSG